MKRVGGKNQRWRPAVAIVCALSVFVALVAGWSLRPALAASELPEPAAWSHTGPEAAAHATTAGAQAHSPLSTPPKKPFHSSWMTRQRPTSSVRTMPRSTGPTVPPTRNAVEPIGWRVDRLAVGHVAAVSLLEICVARC